MSAPDKEIPQNDGIEISPDKSRLDLRFIHDFLSRSYWAEGIPFDLMEKAIENSLCFGVFKSGRQIGYARVVTDYTVIAYIFDLFIIEEERGKGYSKSLMKYILNYPEVSGVKKWMLATKDASGLYSKFGFNKLNDPNKYMELIGYASYKDKFYKSN
ncbi:MAG TPA: GNAT family N-acetyltransferase [Ignavibacteriales bacterium]|nr:GNAT family N-acetyltransferase [Ignavibacteriales bacterium]HEX3073052.1 GNAT family N-acetyltransferase [Ignavibacteriales bacterium]